MSRNAKFATILIAVAIFGAAMALAVIVLSGEAVIR